MSSYHSKASLSRSTDELHRRLTRTELSLNNLEKMSVKSDQVSESKHGDESHMMPPLTLEELMQESSLLGSYRSHNTTANQDPEFVLHEANRMPLPRRASSPVGTGQFASKSAVMEHTLVDALGNISEVTLDASALATPMHVLNRDDSRISDRPIRDYDSAARISVGNLYEDAVSGMLASDTYGGDVHSEGTVSRDVSPQRPLSARSNMTSVTLVAADAQTDQLENQLSSVYADNARLRTLVTQLRKHVASHTDIDKKPRTQHDQSAIDDQISVQHLKDKVECLNDENKANQRALRKNEEELDKREQLCAQKNHVIQEFRKEVFHLRKVLDQEKSNAISFQKERDEALQNAGSCAVKLRASQTLMSTQFNESQRLLKNDLARIAEERGTLVAELRLTKSNNLELSTKLRELQSRQSAAESKNRSQELEVAKTLDQAQARIRELVTELETKHKNLKHCSTEINDLRSLHDSLKSEVEELQQHNELQRDRLAECQSECETYRTEVAKLEGRLSLAERLRKHDTDIVLGGSAGGTAPLERDILSEVTNRPMKESMKSNSSSLEISPRKHRSMMLELEMKLSAKEALVKRLEARLSGYAAESEKLEGIQTELLEVVEKSRLGDRRCNQLEDLVHSLEDEKSRLVKQVSDLEDVLHDKHSENESLEQRLKERTGNLTKTQVEMETLARKSLHLDETLKRVNEELSSVKQDLEQQMKEVAKSREKLAERDAALEEKSRSLEQAVDTMSSKENEHCRELKRLKQFHTEQTHELMDQAQELVKERDRHNTKAATVAQENSVLNDALQNATNQVHYLEKQVKLLESERVMNQRTHEEALEILEQKASYGSDQVKALEGALAKCKTDIATYMEQMTGTQGSFQRELALKQDTIAKLETELKLVNCSLIDESKRCTELESALNERHVMLEEAASRISDLEESQQSLQAQVAQLEQHLTRERSEKNCLTEEIEGKLQLACHSLDKKNREFTELNDALRQVDHDFNGCKAELVAIEDHVIELNEENAEKTRELEQSRFEWTEMKNKLDKKFEEIAKLEDKLSDLNRENKKLREKCLDLETEMTQAKSDAETSRSQKDALKSCVEDHHAEIESKDVTIKSLQVALKLAEDEHKKRCEEVFALEHTLEERQGQLQVRVAQLSQLDAQVREFRLSTEKRNAELEAKLESSENQLRERNIQISQLDERYSSMRDDIGEARHVIEEHQHIVRKLENDVESRDVRIRELEKAVSTEYDAREEQHKQRLETSQELRYVRECEREASKQCQESRRETNRLNKEVEQVVANLEQLRREAQEKDERLSRLGKQLATADAEKTAIESRYQEELDKTQRDVQEICERHKKEMEMLQASNANLTVQMTSHSGDLGQEFKSATERQRQTEQELERAKESAVALERELLARKQVIEAANDTIIVKDAEIARLLAKISGLEREATMTSMPSSTSSKRRSENHVITSNCPIPTNPAWSSPCKDDDMTSLFTDGGSNVGSLAPSFVPIAASTRRPTDAKRSLFFVTSSPSKQLHSLPDSSPPIDEDSLYRRVFADSRRADFLVDLDSSRDDTRDFPTTQPSCSTSVQSLDFDEMLPDKCMAELQQKLRASERRRRDVTSKLRNLKSSGS